MNSWLLISSHIHLSMHFHSTLPHLTPHPSLTQLCQCCFVKFFILEHQFRRTKCRLKKMHSLCLGTESIQLLNSFLITPPLSVTNRLGLVPFFHQLRHKPVFLEHAFVSWQSENDQFPFTESCEENEWQSNQDVYTWCMLLQSAQINSSFGPLGSFSPFDTVPTKTFLSAALRTAVNAL